MRCIIAALALAVIALEIGTTLQARLSSPVNLTARLWREQKWRPRTTWEALLVAVLPGRFDPNQEASKSNVIDLLRRAGYPMTRLVSITLQPSNISLFTL